MSNSNEKKEEKSPEKLLKKKRNSTYSLEDIINIYCCRHKIQDNEIIEKIKTIYYEKPSELIKINYNKDKGDKFPLSSHIKPAHLKKEIENEEKEEKREKEKEKEEKKEEEQEQDGILNCFLCGWEFLKGMSLQEKNTHINLCAEGKGEQNKKELISTYIEIENFQKQNEAKENDNENNNVNNESQINVRNGNLEKNNENKKEEDDSEDDDDEEEEEEEIKSRKNNRRKLVDDNNDDLML